MNAIPIRPQGDSSVGNVAALLNEVATLLHELANTGSNGAIDLQSLPFSPDEYEQLRQALGEGEVSARLEAIGRSEIVETHFPGVWWVTHFNVEGDIIADLIEVTAIPSILLSQPEDVNAGLLRLQEMLGDKTEARQ